MISWEEILIKLALASLFGAFIGLERERKNLTAGLRTHMMVCVGSCLIMIVSAFGFSDILGTDNVNLDPSRIAAQVVSGIGFIGAGTILFLKQGTVHGLTTASGLWTVAAIGLATGGGLYFAAGATTVIALIILWGLQQLEHIYSSRFKLKSLNIAFGNHEKAVEILNFMIENDELKMQTFSLEKIKDDYVLKVKFDEKVSDNIEKIISSLAQHKEVKSLYWENTV